MEKIKKLWCSIPIRTAFVLTVVVFVLLATFATSRTSSWAMDNIMQISRAYNNYSYTENENGVIYNIVPAENTLSAEDRASYQFYHAVYNYSALLWYVVVVKAELP